MSSISINQLRDLSSLFSRREVCRWLEDDFKSINIKLSRYDLMDKNKGSSYLKVLKNTYKLLEKKYPNEYILKNEFLNKWIQRELGNNDSVVFNEFRLGKAIADLAMFNGVSKVFEIKTVLDKEYRLLNQLDVYKRLFNEVYIIIPEEFLEKYIDYDESVGVITYDSREFKKKRKPIANQVIDVDVLMQVLHTREYIGIVQQYYKELPSMSAFNQFEISKKLISNIPQNRLNCFFIDTMKKRNINNFFFKSLNREFNQICLSLNLNEEQKNNLIFKLQTNKI